MNKDKSLNFAICLSMILLVFLTISSYYLANISIHDEVNFLGSVVFNTISKVAVPIIFMAFGAILISKPLKFNEYKKNAIKLILFIISWTAIFFLFYKYILYDNVNMSVFKLLFEPINWIMAYVYGLLVIYLILPFIQKMILNISKREENLFIILWIIFTGVMNLIKTILSYFDTSVSIGYQVPLVGLSLLGYFIVGYIIYNRYKNIKVKTKYNFNYTFATFITLSATIILTFYISLITKRPFLSLLNIDNLSIMVLSTSLFSLIILNKDIISNAFAVRLEEFSGYFITVYIVHAMLVELTVTYFNIYLSSSFASIPLISIDILFISLLITFVLKKIPFIRKMF